MKWVKRIVLAVFIFLVLVVGLLAAIPFFFKDRVAAAVKHAVNEQVEANVEFGEVSLGLIRSFPDLRVGVKDLSITGQAPFEGDTLVRIDHTFADIDIMTVIKNEPYQINEIQLHHFLIQALSIDSATNNWSIFPQAEEEDTTTSTALNLALDKVTLKEGYVLYQDVANSTLFIASNINMDSRLAHSEEETTFELTSLAFDSIHAETPEAMASLKAMTTSAEGMWKDSVLTLPNFTIGIASTTLKSAGVTYLNQTEVAIETGARANLAESTYTLDSLQLGLNDFSLRVDGMVKTLAEGMDIDLSLATNQNEFKSLLSLVPAIYTHSFDDLEASGRVALNGAIKGRLVGESIPAFNLNLSVENGAFAYPDLPAKLSDVHLDLKAHQNENSLSALSIQIPDAHFSLDDEPFRLALQVDDPMGNPYVDLLADGQLDLARIPDLVELEDVETLSGKLVVEDLLFKGRVSDLENQAINKVEASGNVSLSDVEAAGSFAPLPLSVPTFDLSFSNAMAKLNTCSLRIGESDIQMTGEMRNPVGYAFADEDLTGQLNITSKRLNLDELGGDENTSEESEASKPIQVPDRITFKTNATVDEVIVDGLTLSETKGAVRLEDQAVYLDSYSAKMLGGTATISGFYSTRTNPSEPEVEFSYDIDQFDIGQTFAYANTVQKLAPVAEYLQGTFNSNMQLKTSLRSDNSINLEDLIGDGEIRIPYAQLQEIPLMRGLNNTLNITGKSPLNSPEINDAWTVVKFQDGKMAVEPFTVSFGDIRMDIQGLNGLDKSIDYELAVTLPSDKFGGAASMANSFLQSANIPLLNLSAPKNLTFHLGVDGSFDDPKIKMKRVSADGSDQSIQESIKEEIKDQVQDQVDNAKDEVRDRVKDEVDETKEEVKEEVKDKVDETKEEVKDKIRDRVRGWGF